MTKKDYIAIASIIRGISDTATPGETKVGLIVDGLGKLFEKDNPRFDRERFKAACLSW